MAHNAHYTQFHHAPEPPVESIQPDLRSKQYNIRSSYQQNYKSHLMNAAFTERGFNEATQTCSLPQNSLPSWPVSKSAHRWRLPDQDSTSYNQEHRARFNKSRYLVPRHMTFEAALTEPASSILDATYPNYFAEQRKMRRTYYPEQHSLYHSSYKPRRSWCV